MNRHLSLFAFSLGLLAVVWVAIGYIGSHMLAFTVSCVIATVYMAGALEMRRFHANTSALAGALGNIPDDISHLGAWLQQVPTALQNAVRLRIEGERVTLPGPGVTPYLVGLLVLLGMLGTFLGMVVTLNGAVLALESTTDLHTIRAALAAPVKGLGVAFGTSVAGVATSAMLGLISALCRRDRQRIGQMLDGKIAGVLRDFSLTYQRQETFKVLQMQAQALPELIGKLDLLMTRMSEQNRQLGAHLLTGQQRFHDETKELYSRLAESVDQSLKSSLRDSATLAAASIEPVVTSTMAGIASETRSLHDKLFGTVDRQLSGITGQFTETVNSVSAHWDQALNHHAQATNAQHRQLNSAFTAYADTFDQRAAALITSLEGTQSRLQAEMRVSQQAWQDAWVAGEQTRQANFSEALSGMAGRLEKQWQEAGQATLAQQEQITHTLGETARDLVTATRQQAETTIAEVTRLMQTAAEAPKAAAEVIGQLRHELSASMAHDNKLLAERKHIMATLGALLDTINHASTEQRAAIDALLASSAILLERVGSEFAARVETEAGKLVDIGSSMTGSALEVASLSDAFGHAVQLFSTASDKMTGALQRIEGGLAKSLSRSDEQLAYYVAQAREIIDLSIMSQKRMVDDLQRVAQHSDTSGAA